MTSNYNTYHYKNMHMQTIASHRDNPIENLKMIQVYQQHRQ